jgi:hypothetical protein
VNDPMIVLGWVWAIYLAARLAGEAVDAVFLPRLLKSAPPASTDATGPIEPRASSLSASSPRASSGRRRDRRWTPLPAVLWLAGEGLVAAIVVGVVWFSLRDTSVNLVPAAVSAAPGDVRRVAVAVIVCWTLFVLNVPVAMRLISRLLPQEPKPKKPAGGVDPERMGATIGVLERALIVALLPGGGPAAVGFVMTAKTLARFKELDKKRFAERYLLGTMASVTVALISSLAAQWLWVNQI